MPFVTDTFPQLLALIDGAFAAAADAGSDAAPAQPQTGPRPGDVGWLVLADWLEEHDDPRAALLRLAVANDWSGVANWVAQHSLAWLGKLPRGVHIRTAYPSHELPGLNLSLSPAAKITPPLAAAVAAGWLTLAQCNPELHLPQCPGIRRLVLDSAADDQVLSAAAKIPTLQTLCISSGRHLTSQGYALLADCPRLHRLKINKGVFLSDESLASLAKCHSLRELMLARCQNVGGTGVAELSELRSFSIFGCARLTRDGLASFRNLTKLESLRFGSDKMRGTTLARLGQLPSLRKLDLSGCTQLVESGLACLAVLPALEELNLSHCDLVTGVTLGKLAQPQVLKALNMNNCPLSLEGILPVRYLTGLRELELSRPCSSMTGGDSFAADAAASCLWSLIQLRKLHLVNWRNLSGAGLQSLSGMVRLEDLSLNSCYSVEDGDLAYLAALVEMRRLNLSGCAKLKGDGLRHLAKCRSLEALDLANCMGLTKQGLAALQDLRQLRTLQLTSITNGMLASLTGLSGLRQLSIQVIELENAGLTHLGTLSGLVDLSLSGSGKSSITSLAPLAGLSRLQRLALHLHLNASQVDSALTHILHLKELRTLHVSGKFTCELLAKFKALPHLRDLSFSQTGLPPDQVQRLREELPNCAVRGN